MLIQATSVHSFPHLWVLFCFACFVFNSYFFGPTLDRDKLVNFHFDHVAFFFFSPLVKLKVP